MKKYQLVVLFLMATVSYTHAQKTGISFTKNLTWAQVKEKARQQNKFIFMDVYTTWCVPCKVMATEIFPQKQAGDFFNSNFINVAVQFDKTKHDSREVKSWYTDVKELETLYKINSYPTYLFFTPDGKLVHRVEGTSPTVSDFITKAKFALELSQPYARLKQQYDAGERDPAFLLKLLKAAQQANDTKFIKTAANAYLSTQADLLTPDNLRLVALATTKSTDPGFKVLLNNGAKVDALAGKNVSRQLFNTIVFDEAVLPFVRKNGTKTDYGGGMVMYSGDLEKSPDWAVLAQKLNQLYPGRADEIIRRAKPVYYSWAEDWPQFTNAVSDYYHHTDAEALSTNDLNQYAYSVFQRSSDSAELDTALTWSRATLAGVNQSNVLYLYTYVNLLYKAGKKQEAIAAIENATQLPEDQRKQMANLAAKMKNNEKTW